jgi:hypothetical protein
MDVKHLEFALKIMRNQSTEGHKKSVGKRGARSPQSDFYVGSIATLDIILKAIAKDDIAILKEW